MATLPSFVSSFIVETNYETTDIIFFSMVNTKDDKIVVGYSVDEFFGALIENHVTNLYIHDFNFISSYIIDYILKNNYVYNPSGRFGYDGDFAYNMFRDDSGHVYYIKLFFKTSDGLRSCELRSSKNKTMSSISSMYHGFKLDIDTDVDIDNISDITKQLGPTDEITDYDKEEAIVSAIIVASVIKQLKRVGYNRLTIGSDALKQWIKLDGDNSYLLPRLDDDVDKDLREAYRGGFTWINKNYKDKELGSGLVLDVNSLYPWTMRNFPMPIGHSTWENNVNVVFGINKDNKIVLLKTRHTLDEVDDNDQYFVVHVKITAIIKDNHIPCVSNMKQKKNPGAASIVSNEYIEELINHDAWLTMFDLQAVFDMYDVDYIHYYGCYLFDVKSGMFDNFIDYHYNIKRTSIGAKRQLSKLMLDSIYGRFGIKTDKKTSLPKIVDGKLKFDDGNVLEDRTVRYLPIAVFITSIARYYMLKDALDVYDRLAYIDTDSLHLIGDDIPDGFDISDQLGDYKIEARFTRARYVGLKTYIHDEVIDNNIETVVKMAGAPDTVKRHVGWHNFASGVSVPGKYYIRILPGGFIRCQTTFKITSV